MRTVLKTIILVLLFSVLAGCGAAEPVKKPQARDSQARQQIQVDPELAAKVKNKAKTVRGVQDSTAVVINSDVCAAVKVSGLDRFRLKAIREEVHKKLSALGSEYEVHVTTDKKLFSEIQKMERRIESGKTGPPAEIKKKMDKINEDMQG
ncbi:MAG: YhcN/YlaJ family sporulation lipoprotein [Actinobacteria bacterium]|nr:YhcN/YlaJ family sporulation lipoprotein [Actinomycetota bacterium]